MDDAHVMIATTIIIIRAYHDLNYYDWQAVDDAKGALEQERWKHAAKEEHYKRQAPHSPPSLDAK